MTDQLKKILFRLRLDGTVRALANVVRRRTRFLIRQPPYSDEIQQQISQSIDPVRFASVSLAMTTVDRSAIPGHVAEVGVYRGEMSQFLHKLAPQRKLFLFDTFEGFPTQDLETARDERFRDTDVETVKKALGDLTNVVIRKGYFPETAAGLESEQFALVVIDLDLYRATLAALDFFYPRLAPGGYGFLHDYNCAESDWAVSRAAAKFFHGKPEYLIELPDTYGTAVFRKV
jgi:O-methyltransferase